MLTIIKKLVSIRKLSISNFSKRNQFYFVYFIAIFAYKWRDNQRKNLIMVQVIPVVSKYGLVFIPMMTNLI